MGLLAKRLKKLPVRIHAMTLCHDMCHQVSTSIQTRLCARAQQPRQEPAHCHLHCAEAIPRPNKRKSTMYPSKQRVWKRTNVNTGAMVVHSHKHTWLFVELCSKTLYSIRTTCRSEVCTSAAEVFTLVLLGQIAH